MFKASPVKPALYILANRDFSPIETFTAWGWLNAMRKAKELCEKHNLQEARVLMQTCNGTIGFYEEGTEVNVPDSNLAH